MADPEAWLCDQIRAHVPTVSTDLPPKFEAGTLPAVQVLGLPGALESRAWGGKALRWTLPCDVDVYAGSREQAADVCRELGGHLDGLTADGIRVEVTSTPHERPDFNNNIRRFGMIVTLYGG